MADAPGTNTPIAAMGNRWVSHDLQMLRSGLFADAEIICEGDATPRKVHRNILVGRSAWFKKAFNGQFKEAEERKVILQETPWRVDLMLRFFYSGSIDLGDEALKDGHHVIEISIELLRLGDFFQSADMHLYGESMLTTLLTMILDRGCNMEADPAANEAQFKMATDFPHHFCGAVVNAFDKDRPVKLAQDILADFAFAARVHLFENEEFVSFTRDNVVPDFGNRVLTALMTGSVSNVLDGNSVFKQWQDWRTAPHKAQTPPPEAEAPIVSNTTSPAVTSASATAPPQAASGPASAPPAVTSGPVTAPQPVAAGFGAASPAAATGSSTTPPTVSNGTVTTLIGAANINSTAPSAVPNRVRTFLPTGAPSRRGRRRRGGGGRGGGQGG